LDEHDLRGLVQQNKPFIDALCELANLVYRDHDKAILLEKCKSEMQKMPRPVLHGSPGAVGLNRVVGNTPDTLTDRLVAFKAFNDAVSRVRHFRSGVRRSNDVKYPSVYTYLRQHFDDTRNVFECLLVACRSLSRRMSKDIDMQRGTWMGEMHHHFDILSGQLMHFPKDDLPYNSLTVNFKKEICNLIRTLFFIPKLEFDGDKFDGCTFNELFDHQEMRQLFHANKRFIDVCQLFVASFIAYHESTPCFEDKELRNYYKTERMCEEEDRWNHNHAALKRQRQSEINDQQDRHKKQLLESKKSEVVTEMIKSGGVFDDQLAKWTRKNDIQEDDDICVLFATNQEPRTFLGKRAVDTVVAYYPQTDPHKLMESIFENIKHGELHIQMSERIQQDLSQVDEFFHEEGDIDDAWNMFKRKNKKIGVNLSTHERLRSILSRLMKM
jgi:hypothetical protein